MPRYQIRIQSGTTRLNPRFKDLAFIESKLQKRISKLEPKVNVFIRNRIRNALRKNRVYKAFVNPPYGVRGSDLVAEFGLTDSEASELIQIEMMDILLFRATNIEHSETSKEASGKQSAGVTVRLKGRYLDPDKYYKDLTKAPFFYYSRKQRSAARKRKGFRGSTYKIEWMKWLLEAYRGNAVIYSSLNNIKSYGITYDLEHGMARFSRSGRALMLRKTPTNKKRLESRYFPYTMPEIARPRAGAKNFIDEVARDKDFVSNLNDGIKNIFDRTLKLGG